MPPNSLFFGTFWIWLAPMVVRTKDASRSSKSLDNITLSLFQHVLPYSFIMWVISIQYSSYGILSIMAKLDQIVSYFHQFIVIKMDHLASLLPIFLYLCSFVHFKCNVLNNFSWIMIYLFMN